MTHHDVVAKLRQLIYLWASLEGPHLTQKPGAVTCRVGIGRAILGETGKTAWDSVPDQPRHWSHIVVKN